jgi:hypothetical protein
LKTSFEKMSLEFDAIKMATEVALECMIGGNLKLETTDDIGERGGIPRCGRGWSVLGRSVQCVRKSRRLRWHWWLQWLVVNGLVTRSTELRLARWPSGSL